jgi:hypothetical protein
VRWPLPDAGRPPAWFWHIARSLEGSRRCREGIGIDAGFTKEEAWRQEQGSLAPYPSPSRVYFCVSQHARLGAPISDHPMGRTPGGVIRTTPRPDNSVQPTAGRVPRTRDRVEVTEKKSRSVWFGAPVLCDGWRSQGVQRLKQSSSLRERHRPSKAGDSGVIRLVAAISSSTRPDSSAQPRECHEHGRRDEVSRLRFRRR